MGFASDGPLPKSVLLLKRIRRPTFSVGTECLSIRHAALTAGWNFAKMI